MASPTDSDAGFVHIADPSDPFSAVRDATLTLSSGPSMKGYSFGAETAISGEVVFNTGMVGYPESLTDPSYAGQILVITYPLVGNYGVPDEAAVEEDVIVESLSPASSTEKVRFLSKHFEGAKIYLKGVIIADYGLEEFSHYQARKSLGRWLKEQGVPGLFGIDTRSLTKLIRREGAVLGRIEFLFNKKNSTPDSDNPLLDDPNLRLLAAEVSTKEILTYKPKMAPKSCRILLIDFGVKFNIIRFLVKHLKAEVVRVPYDYDYNSNDAKIDFDGILLSNGPGDPSLLEKSIETLRTWMRAEEQAWTEKGKNPKPIFGICLGNQILALAAGAKTFKMKFGNRGMNQPVVDLRTLR